VPDTEPVSAVLPSDELLTKTATDVVPPADQRFDDRARHTRPDRQRIVSCGSGQLSDPGAVPSVNVLLCDTPESWPVAPGVVADRDSSAFSVTGHDQAPSSSATAPHTRGVAVRAGDGNAHRLAREEPGAITVVAADRDLEPGE
jgi:hypothetical protein